MKDKASFIQFLSTLTHEERTRVIDETRRLAKLTHDEQMHGIYKAQRHSVHRAREDSSIEATMQSRARIEFPKKSNKKAESYAAESYATRKDFTSAENEGWWLAESGSIGQLKRKHVASLYYMLLIHELKNSFHPILQTVECLQRSIYSNPLEINKRIVEQLATQIQKIPHIIEELAAHYQPVNTCDFAKKEAMSRRNIKALSKSTQSKTMREVNRALRKLAHDERMQGVYGTQNKRMHGVRENFESARLPRSVSRVECGGESIDLMKLTRQVILEHFKHMAYRIQIIHTHSSSPLIIKQFSFINNSRAHAHATASAEGGASIACNKKYIEYLMLNLLHNAVKYSDDRIFVHIHSIQTTQTEGGAEKIRVAISNNCHLPDFKIVQSILDDNSNEQLHHFSLRQRMGLALCSTILRLHESALRASWSKKYQRITLHFTLWHY
ncbi:hypothetical protein Sarmat_01165 [Rickettsiales endosymbiont of Paramecium tredecaurelia]|uniref:ATP-binding protein n=1 Tax=Candidatus Sarmatiella mevalonica TaxID=2770581 RepID=UPI001921A23E|nr:ATP-binding protein [Candidatus Sarmatiella mevalonica]MBL3285292.1 hypothetical protein [Candidatus Sarmatiella mevalonica]